MSGTGRGSTAGLMAYGDANAIAMEIGEHEVLPVVEEIPVICGVHGSDPRRLRSRIGEIQPFRHAMLEQVEMFRQHYTGLHHVQIVYPRSIYRQQGG